MTRIIDSGGPNWTVYYRYYSASGGETSCDFNTGSSVIGYFAYFVDNEIDNTNPVDNTVAWAGSGEGFAVPHQFDITVGADAGIAIAVCDPGSTGTGGTSIISGTGTLGIAYKTGLSAGAVALNWDLPSAGFANAAVVSFNYAAAGPAQILLGQAMM